MTDNYTLQNRVAIITGGGSGIGLAITERLAQAGAHTVIFSLIQEEVTLHAQEVRHFPPSDELEAARRQIEAAGPGDCLAVAGDVTQLPDIERLVHETLERFDRIDILVNCAATSTVHPILNHPIDSWRRVIDVNLIGAFQCIQVALPHLIENGWGRVINIGSTAATMGFPDYSAYAAAKHGLLGLTRTLALEVADKNITTNMISPSAVETPSRHLFVQHHAEQHNITFDEKWQAAIEHSPQKRLIQPEEIADLVYYLTQESARGVTGEDLRITTGSPR